MGHFLLEDPTSQPEEDPETSNSHLWKPTGLGGRHQDPVSLNAPLRSFPLKAVKKTTSELPIQDCIYAEK